MTPANLSGPICAVNLAASQGYAGLMISVEAEQG